MDTKANSHFGKKVLYSLVIGMSGLILLLSAAGIIGVWLIKQPVSDAAVTIFSTVESTTKTVRAVIANVDQTLAVLGEKVTEISAATDQISQNVDDKGLVLTLLPPEKEQQLIDTANSIRDTFAGIRAAIADGLELYRSINRLPFVNLPGPSEDQLTKLDGSMAQIQAMVETLRSSMADIRAGVAGAIDKLVGAADQITNEINEIQDALAQIDSGLASLEEFSIQMQQVIPDALLAAAVFLSLIFAFLVFTQVVVVRQYVAAWRNLGQSQMALPAETVARTDQERITSPQAELPAEVPAQIDLEEPEGPEEN